jgi:hypothetical protein
MRNLATDSPRLFLEAALFRSIAISLAQIAKKHPSASADIEILQNQLIKATIDWN